MRESIRDAEHLFRLVLLFAAGLLLFLLVRALLVPVGFGELGHFRSGAIDDNRGRPLRYAGRAACAECHDDAASELAAGRHARIGCESCHGPLAAHAADPDAAAAMLPEATPLCVRCHEANLARPAGHPQVEPREHADGSACADCHRPHLPAV